MFWRDGPEQDEPSAFIHLPPFLRHTLFKLFGDMFWRDLPDLEQLSPLRLTHLPAALYPQTLGERFWRELVFLDLLKDLTLLKIFLSLERFSKDSRDDLSESGLGWDLSEDLDFTIVAEVDEEGFFGVVKVGEHRDF